MPIYPAPTAGAKLMGQRPGSLWGIGWRPIVLLPPADVYLNFAQGYGVQSGATGPVANLLTTTRASVAYEDDSSGNWTQFAANTPRITNKGLLVEEARTNSIRNNSMQGAVAGTIGSGGAYPTNWTALNTSGLTFNIIGVGVENGIDYIDIRVSGTSTNNVVRIAPESNAQIAATNGQAWTSSLFAKLQAGSLSNITSVVNKWWTLNSSHTTLSIYGNAFITPTGASLGSQRTQASGTIADATVANVQPVLELNLTGTTVAVDVTLRIGWPQFEQGAWATSPIQTTNAAVTRAADVVTLTTPPTFGGSFSLYAAGTPISPTTATSHYILAATGSANIGRSGAGGGGLFHVIMTGGINAFGVVINPLVAAKLSGAFAPSDQVGVLNGGVPITTGSGGSPPAPSGVSFGSAGGQYWNGYITEAAIWATVRLTNAQLTARTT